MLRTIPENMAKPEKIYQGICPECVKTDLQIDIKPTAQIEPYYTLCHTHNIMQQSTQPKGKTVIKPKSSKTPS